MNEEFEKEFNKLSEKDKREVNNLIRFMQEKKYHDKQYEELLNQYIEMARDFDKLQSNWNSLREFVKENGFYERQDIIDAICNPNEDKLIYIDDVLDKMNELESSDNK